MTLSQETMWAYSTTAPSTTRANLGPVTTWTRIIAIT